MEEENKEKLRSGQDVGKDIEKAYPEAYRLARKFHEYYEENAPFFGYITKEETKEFDPASNNGRLMAYVCKTIVDEERHQAVKEEKIGLLEKMRERMEGMKVPAINDERYFEKNGVLKSLRLRKTNDPKINSGLELGYNQALQDQISYIEETIKKLKVLHFVTV